MKRLVEWNCKEKNSALPAAINEFGDTYSMEDICAQLATLYDVIGDCDLDHLGRLVKVGRCSQCDNFSNKYSWCYPNETHMEETDFCSYFEPRNHSNQ